MYVVGTYKNSRTQEQLDEENATSDVSSTMQLFSREEA